MFVFQGNNVLIRNGLLECEEAPMGAARCSKDFPEIWQALPSWCEVKEDYAPGEGEEFTGLRQVWHRYGEAAFARAGGAWQFANWWRNVRLCSFCGEGLVPSETDHGRCCPKCGRAFFAPLSPAVIAGTFQRPGRVRGTGGDPRRGCGPRGAGGGLDRGPGHPLL